MFEYSVPDWLYLHTRQLPSDRGKPVKDENFWLNQAILDCSGMCSPAEEQSQDMFQSHTYTTAVTHSQ